MSASGPNGWPFVALGLGLLAVLPAAILLVWKRKADTEEVFEEEDAEPDGDAFDVYFGSQTGTAESFAQIIAAEGRRHGLSLIHI